VGGRSSSLTAWRTFFQETNQQKTHPIKKEQQSKAIPALDRFISLSLER
jgi:hypothetical protein